MPIKKNGVYRLTGGDKEIFQKACDPSDGIGANWFTSYYFGRELREWQWNFHHANAKQITVVGGCVAGDTVLHGQTKPIKELAGRPITVLAWGGDKFVWAKATAPFHKGRKVLYEVKLANGQSIKVTDDHRFLTAKGYVHLRKLALGEPLGICDLPQFAPQSHNSNVQNCWQTTSNSQDCYSLGRHPDDEQLRPITNTGLDAAPLPDDVLEYTSLNYTTIISIEPVGVDDYYDLHVPKHFNYVAHGIVNHNTGSGKTVGAGLSYATWAATTPMFSFMALAPT